MVPFGVATTLPGVKHMLMLVEKNPSALVAKFDVTDAVEANFVTRAKMGQSSDVYAVAITTDGKACSRRRKSRSPSAAAAAERATLPFLQIDSGDPTWQTRCASARKQQAATPPSVCS